MKSQGRQFTDTIYEQLGRIGKAVASPRRLELLDLLSQGPRTVEALAREADQSIANTSSHLQVLRSSRLVDTEKEGTYVTYRLADDEVSGFFRSLRMTAESRLADLERTTRKYLGKWDEADSVDQELLLERVKNGEVDVLDVRPVEEYLAGHIPGSRSIPLGMLRRRVTGLSKNRGIVVYCRGPYSAMAVKAVETLRSRGYNAARLTAGVVDWRAYGLEVVVGEEPS